MSTVVRTRYGAMRVNYTIAEVCGIAGPACLAVLHANDNSGCYWPDAPDDPMTCEGHTWSLADVRLQVLVELDCSDDAIEWHETDRVDRLRDQLRARME